jgi:hypothetical protein
MEEVDPRPLRDKFYAGTYVSFVNDVRDIIDSLKQGNEFQRIVAERLDKLDLNSEEGRRIATSELSEFFDRYFPRRARYEAEPEEGGRRRRRKTRRSKKVRRTRKSRR